MKTAEQAVSQDVLIIGTAVVQAIEKRFATAVVGVGTGDSSLVLLKQASLLQDSRSRIAPGIADSSKHQGEMLMRLMKYHTARVG